MKRMMLTMVLCLTALLPSAAQKGQKYGTTKDKKAYALLKEGNDMVIYAKPGDSDALRAALRKFLEAAERDPQYMEALFSAAELYKDLKEWENQIRMIERGVAVDSTYYVPAYYNCAVALCHAQRYEEALQWFDLFDRHSTGRKLHLTLDPSWKQRALAVVDMMRHPVPFESSYPTPYIAESPFETYWPSVSLDENELVMTSRLPIDTAAFRSDPTMIARINNNETQEDLYFSRRASVSAPWQPLHPVPGINSAFNEGTQSLSPDGRWMFYTACGYADSKGSCDIYFSQRTDKGWTKGINVGEPVNSRNWETQPCFSADGKTLFFVRGRASSSYRHGNIYMAKVKGIRSNGVPIFDIPTALGDSINTDADESHPFIHHDGKTLYFSSDGWPGLGGKDIFVSRMKEDGTWSTPRNLGYPINNTDDDEGLVVTASGKTAYYNSVSPTEKAYRKREVRTFELYPDIRPTPVPFARGTITSCKTHEPIDATIMLDRMPDGTRIVTARTLPDGSFTTAMPGESDYLLSVTARGFFFRSHKFTVADVANLHGPKTFTDDEVCLAPLEVGQKIALRNIYFDTDKWDIRPESAVELDKLLQIMKENPKLRIEISGHTDSRASAQHNQTLSENRAKATVDYLVRRGIAATRFTQVGYGFREPCATNDTEEGRALNRRIEAKIIK